MIANIASDDALILPHRANPAGLNFREPQVFDPDDIRILVGAFDKAWEAVQASGEVFDSKARVDTARAILAKHIIAAAKDGERDEVDGVPGGRSQIRRLADDFEYCLPTTSHYFNGLWRRSPKARSFA